MQSLGFRNQEGKKKSKKGIELISKSEREKATNDGKQGADETIFAKLEDELLLQLADSSSTFKCKGNDDRTRISFSST